MSDIHQEWRELRQKNGDFICHLDGEMAKIEKEKVELKRREQKQDLLDAGAFAMQLIAPLPFNCCQDDRDILKALNKAQADRIETLEKEIIARKEQEQIDLAIKKDLDKKLDKVMADYRALWVENKDLKSQLASEKAQHEEKIDNAGQSYARLAIERNNLAETVSKMEKMIRDLDERNGTLRERLANTNASLKRSVQKESDLQSNIDFIEAIMEKQAKEIKRLHEIVDAVNGSCSAYTQQGMQSKIAKQTNEIKRLTGDNIRLKNGIESLNKRLNELSYQNAVQNANVSCAMDEIKRLTEENKQLHKALDIAAKDADANFERGKIKGMTEIWKELGDCYDGRPISENNKIFGYYTVGNILMNLSPTWFINRAEEYHKQKEKEEARDIKIGDEVVVIIPVSSDDPDYNVGIVTAVDEDHECFVVVGPKFEGCFDVTDIDAGNVRKTGKHYDAIPIDYFT